MTISKRWYRSRRNQMIIVTVIIFLILYYISLSDSLHTEPDLDVTRRLKLITSKPSSDILVSVSKVAYLLEPPNVNIRFIERRLEQALKQDKGTGCQIPKLDPFSKEVTQFDKEMPKVACQGRDWVKCYHSQCKVVPEILDTMRNIVCTYSDIIYESDQKYVIGEPFEVYGADAYVLTKSDHVKVKCSGTHKDSILPVKWIGHCVGFRSSVQPKKPPPGREDSLNVLILGFDSTSKNGFIRRMPKSYKILTQKLRATVLNGYNIVGDGTPAALFPILTGKTELELPDVRRKMNNATLDSMPFIFKKLKDDGYRTAYFEDMPWIGTFQYRFNGFMHQPADHYLRAFYLEESHNGKKWSSNKIKYCVGDTPQYKLMLNITDQFLRLDGKRFCFTFIADITHDDFNMISTADDDTADFLTNFLKSGMGEDTLLMVMGDHGPRYAKVRNTLQGKLEERLPLMAIRLPDSFRIKHWKMQDNLDNNADVLTTPHDIHATVLDFLDLRKYWNPYKVSGADLTRGLSLLRPITQNRSCSEAGVEPHWCSCVSWEELPSGSERHAAAADALLRHVNALTDSVRSKCIVRTLKSVPWVMKQVANNGVLTFVEAKDTDGYVGRFGARVQQERENYQVKIEVGPGSGMYEASMSYVVKEDRYEINTRDISRTNAYNDEPSCISATNPHLNKFCYCRDNIH
ncbi:uncharacterized protein LOC126778468 isoform X2 [Nymphalis io]|uniref:uncharacterized protein LOC126778468 isoform X2 n=1 Tax=Inachis io TaxID=171585 RepID=UPI00216962AD|nr:uncharacterized protein LOC126778468 isoform X2 [Nymphalis io]